MKQRVKSSTTNRIAFIGNHSLRQCGIATFTTDLYDAIAAQYTGTTCIALPVNDIEAGYAHPTRVPDRLVVMSERGAEFLQQIYNVSPEKIDRIPHGIPDVPFVDPSFNKDLFGVEGKTVLLSFGLLSASKGIETVISAMPEIVARYPDIVYIVVGATHSHVIKHEGETYRLSLQWLAQQKRVESNVIFYNRFVSLEELVEFISAADTSIALATGSISGMLEWLEQHNSL